MYPVIFIHIVTCIKMGVLGAWGKGRWVCVVDSQSKLPICSLKSTWIQSSAFNEKQQEITKDGDVPCHFESSIAFLD